MLVQRPFFNVGEVSSAANVVFLAGAQRYAAEYSFFKFHGMTWDFQSSGPQASARIGDINTAVENFHALQKSLYAAKTNMTAAEIEGHFHTTVCLTPAQAIAKGIISAIKEPPF
jgi:ATP-dependent protease ClpP protease subunit